MSLGGIPDDPQPMPPGKTSETGDIGGLPVQVDGHQHSGFFGDMTFSSFRVKGKRRQINVRKGWPCLSRRHHRRRGNKSKIGNDRFIARSEHRLAGKIERRRAGRDGNGVARSRSRCKALLKIFGDATRSQPPALQNPLDSLYFAPVKRNASYRNLVNIPYSLSA